MVSNSRPTVSKCITFYSYNLDGIYYVLLLFFRVYNRAEGAKPVHFVRAAVRRISFFSIAFHLWPIAKSCLSTVLKLLNCVFKTATPKCGTPLCARPAGNFEPSRFRNCNALSSRYTFTSPRDGGSLYLGVDYQPNWRMDRQWCNNGPTYFSAVEEKHEKRRHRTAESAR